MNCVTTIAEKYKRDYITPEDVSEALTQYPVMDVRLDVLEVLAQQANFGAEDSSLCAFIAWKGVKIKSKERR